MTRQPVLHIYPDIEQRSDEWYDQRRGMVTASAIGTLLTPTLRVAANDTSRALTHALAAERILGWTEDTHVSRDMLRGIEHEPYAVDAYQQQTGSVVESCGFMVLEGDGWKIGYSPDGLVGDDGLIEVKCPRAKTHLRYVLADKVPDHYMAQCQAGLLVSGRKWLDFVSFFGGMPLFVKRVTPDPQWQEALIAAAADFEANVREITDTYAAATNGLPATDRVPDPDDIRI